MSRPSPKPPTRRRPAAARVLLLLLVVAGAAGLTLSTTGQRSAPAATKALVSAGTTPAARQYEVGRRVFLRECAWCHGPEGEGTQFGPSLKESGTADADFMLRTGRMPLQSPDQKPEPGPPAYSPGTIAALVRYVGSIGTGTPVPDVDPGDPKEGRTLFMTNCAPCHSSSGTGMIVPDGDWAPELFNTPPTQVAEAVRTGPGQMPEFPESHLDKRKVDDIVSYVRGLGNKQVIGGASLDQFGPIAEGLFAWLVAIPAVVLVIRLLGKKAKR
jgi:ubiquinol-cytochrome c reductase cytochrome c subunit